MKIANRSIGVREPLFVIAEIGLNHGGSAERALAMVDAAARAGASAVKLQTLVAAALVAPSPVRDFFAPFELDEAAHRAVAARARAHDLAFISTPLSLGAVNLLERVGVDAYKIASGDVTFIQLIERCAQTGKPLIIATGASTLDESGRALDIARRAGAREVALLHCVSAYPVPRGQENLRAIVALADAFDVPVGLSDHSPDTFAVPLAVALGASIYERHFILTDGDAAVDAAVSSTPGALAAAIGDAARAAEALGIGVKRAMPAEAGSAASRRGLYAARALHAGHVLTEADVIALRPASELTPAALPALLGRRLTRDIDGGASFLERNLEEVRGVA